MNEFGQRGDGGAEEPPTDSKPKAQKAAAAKGAQGGQQAESGEAAGKELSTAELKAVKKKGAAAAKRGGGEEAGGRGVLKKVEAKKTK